MKGMTKELWHGNIIPGEDSKTANQASVKYPMLFLAKNYLEISKKFLKTYCVFSKKYVIIG